MDLTTKTPDLETETPPPQIHFPNGSLKRHLRPTPVTYKECVKNHAATLGGYSVDGCGEFMLAPDANPLDPATLKCAACGCHRNFHRRDPDDVPVTHFFSFQHNIPPPTRRSTSPSPSPTSPRRATFLCLGPGAAVTPSYSYERAVPEIKEVIQNQMSSLPAVPANNENPKKRKRFRTKFTPEQKKSMLVFAEKLGWKILKTEEKLVEEFCKEAGVTRRVLKVWMHNNKHTYSKSHGSNNGGDTRARFGADVSNGTNKGDEGLHGHFSGNGSSSSSG